VAARELRAAPLAVLDAIPHAIVVLDAAGNIDFVNASWREATEKQLLSGVVGDAFFNVFSDAADIERHHAATHALSAVHAVLDGGRSTSSSQYQRKLGTRSIWFHVSVRRRTDAEAGALVIFEDRTEMREHYTDAVDANRTLRDILDQLARSAIWKDHEGRILGGNASFFAKYGSQSIVGQSFDSIEWPQVIADTFRVLDRQAAESGRRRSAVVELPAADGGLTHWLDLASAPLKRGSGAPRGMINLLMDITQEVLLREEVRRSEHRLRVALDGAQMGAFDVDLASGRATYTARCSEMLFFSPAEFGNSMLNWSSRIHPDDMAETIAQMGEHMRGQTNHYTCEHRMLAKDRSWIWVRESGQIIERRADGTPTRMVGICLDITQERQAHETLQRTARRLRLVTEAAKIGTWEYDFKTGLMAWDDREFEVFGQLPRSFNPGSWIKTVHPDDLERVRGAVDRMTNEFVPLRELFRIVRSDGSIAHIQSYGVVGKSPSGEPLTATGTTIDVTAAAASAEAVLLAKQQLEAANKRLGDFVATATDWLWEADAEGRITYASERFFEVSKIERDEIIGRPITDFELSEVHQSLDPDEVRRFGDRQDFRDLVFQLPLKPGAALPGPYLYVRVSGKAQHDPQGKFAGYLGTATDITEAVHQGNATRQAQKLQAAGTLASGVAHEFNNILAIIRGHADLAKRSLERGEMPEEDLCHVIEAAARGSTLTKGLLTFGRKGASSGVSTFDIGELLAEQRMFLRPLTGPQFELVVERPDTAAFIHADRDGVAQAIMNLVVNARDASPKGGEIRLAVDVVGASAVASRLGKPPTDGRFVRVRVMDNGVGMDESVLQRIFEPFFTTKDVGKGTGLGLQYVYDLVSDSKGYLNVVSEVGCGTAFMLYFPEAAPGETEDLGSNAETPRYEGRTAFVVDDEAALTAIYKAMLEDMGFTAIACADPEAALQLVDNHAGNLDLIVTDVLMPKLEGPHFAELATALRPEVSVLFVTGQPERGARTGAAVPKGAVVLRKPFTRDDLAIAVAKVLQAGAAKSAA